MWSAVRRLGAERIGHGVRCLDPLPRLRDAGLLVTLDSDDPPMFDTDLTNEYRTAYRMGLAPTTSVQLARNGVRCSFADDTTETAILADIDRVADRVTGSA